MSQPFDPRSGLILVEAEVSGPTGMVNATLVLDTHKFHPELRRVRDDSPPLRFREGVGGFQGERVGGD